MNKHNIANYIVHGFSVLVPVLLQISYIRYASYGIESQHFGKFVLIQSLISILSLGLNQIVLQAYSRFYSTEKHLRSFHDNFRVVLLFLNIISSAIMIILGVAFNLDVGLIMLSLAYIVFQDIFSIQAQRYILDGQPSKILFFKIYESTSRFFLPIIMYMYFGTVESLIAGVAVGYVVSAFPRITTLKKLNIRSVNRLDIKRYFRFSYPMVYVSLSSWGITFADRIFVQHFLGFEDLGEYAILCQVASMTMLIHQYYSIVVIPQLYRSYDCDENHTISLFKRHTLILSAVLLTVLIVSITSVPTSLWAIIINPEILYENSNFSIFIILMLSTCFCILQNFIAIFFSLRKNLKILSNIYIIGFTINFIGNFSVINFGITGAATSTAVSWLAIIFLQLSWIRKWK